MKNVPPHITTYSPVTEHRLTEMDRAKGSSGQKT
jgi:hypothetical protein